VGNWIQYILLKMRGELNYFFRVTGGAEPSATATVSQEIFMVAIRATNSGKPLIQIPAFQKFLYYMGNYRPIKTIFLGKKFIIAFFELVKMLVKKLPQWELTRFSLLVN
jgi:hypothetical protein